MLQRLGRAGSARRLTAWTLAAVCGIAGLIVAGPMPPAEAGNLIYTPTNPSFGGNPNNGAFLMNQANAQNIPLATQQAQQAAAAAAAAGGTGGTSGTLTPSQIFAQQLQSPLLSSFANQITQAIFGANAQTSGNFSFGGTSISFFRTGSDINISINDGQSITSIVVPAAP
jgi:curli production assembly/transport component CsgF